MQRMYVCMYILGASAYVCMIQVVKCIYKKESKQVEM